MVSEFRTPVLGSGGTGGGIRQFCEGVGASTIDIANAARTGREGALAVCHDNGVRDVRETMIGHDGMVLATRTAAASLRLAREDVFRAILAELPGGEMPTTRDQVTPDFAARRISMASPASNHGTRAVFEEAVILFGCRAVLGSDTSTDTCLNLRQDNVIEIVGDDTETLARLTEDPDTMGVSGLTSAHPVPALRAFWAEICSPDRISGALHPTRRRRSPAPGPSGTSGCHPAAPSAAASCQGHASGVSRIETRICRRRARISRSGGIEGRPSAAWSASNAVSRPACALAIGREPVAPRWLASPPAGSAAAGSAPGSAPRSRHS